MFFGSLVLGCFYFFGVQFFLSEATVLGDEKMQNAIAGDFRDGYKRYIYKATQSVPFVVNVPKVQRAGQKKLTNPTANLAPPLLALSKGGSSSPTPSRPSSSQSASLCATLRARAWRLS